MPKLPPTVKLLIAGCVILVTAAACVNGTPGPVDGCALMRPIDLTAAGWAALEAADPEGALMLDSHNDAWDRNCDGR